MFGAYSVGRCGMTTTHGERIGTMAILDDQATLTVDEAAHLLGISRGTAYSAVHSGDLPSIRFGTRLVIPSAALKRLLGVDNDH